MCTDIFRMTILSSSRTFNMCLTHVQLAFSIMHGMTRFLLAIGSMFPGKFSMCLSFGCFPPFSSEQKQAGFFFCFFFFLRLHGRWSSMWCLLHDSACCCPSRKNIPRKSSMGSFLFFKCNKSLHEETTAWRINTSDTLMRSHTAGLTHNCVIPLVGIYGHHQSCQIGF